MPPQLHHEATFHPGDKSWHPCDAPVGSNSVVFEDDGETGYLYACSSEFEGNIMDAVHIYNVKQVTDRDKPSKVQIAWSPDGQMAALVINKYVHAVVDFAAKRTCCRTGFPSTSRAFSHDHAWDESVLRDFKAR